jgi:hypothetical protein
MKNQNKKAQSHINQPPHYTYAGETYETIKVIDAWGLNFCLGNAVKYISRAGKKTNDTEIDDIKKAIWYLNHHIETLAKRKKV